jgi:hypothetical protein
MAGLLLHESSRIHQLYREGDPMKNTPHPAATFKHFELLVLIIAPLAMASCSSGGSGDITGNGTVRALSLPGRIELVHAESRSVASRQVSYDDGGRDHSPAAGHTRLDDGDVLDMVNSMLGMIGHSGYAGFVNQGPYTAMARRVDEGRQSRSGDKTISAPADHLMGIYLEVTRSSNSAPMIVKVWVEDKAGPGDGSMLIRGCFSVTHGVSAAYPYGVFFASVKGTLLASDGNPDADLFTMAVSVGSGGGKVVFKNVENGRKNEVAANTSMTEGHVYVNEAQTVGDSAGLQSTANRRVALDAGASLSTEECRDPVFYARDYLQCRVSRYPLFDADPGADVTRNPDFPFEAAGGGHG